MAEDTAGTIETTGADVSGFAVGNEVYGLTNNHFIVGYAEYGYTHWKALLTERGKIVSSVNA